MSKYSSFSIPRPFQIWTFLLATTAAIAQQSTALSFASPVTHPASGFTTDVQLKDFNRDGRADLCIIRPGSSWVNDIEIRLAQPGGSFGPTQSMPLWGQSGEAHLVDLDGDAVPDLVYPDSWGAIHLFRGTESGSFIEWPTLSVQGAFDRITLGDLDGDGNRDLIATSWQGTGVLLKGLGGLNFGPATPLTLPEGVVPGPFPKILDVNGDGKGELLAQSPAGMKILTYSSSGFTEVATLDLGGELFWADCKNTTGNQGDLVVVARNPESGNCRLLTFLATGPFTFATPAAYPYPTMVKPVLVDLDGDGNRDLAWSEGSNLMVLRAEGQGWAAPLLVSSGGPCNLIAAGDLDADGRSDLATVLPNSNEVALLRNTTPQPPHGLGLPTRLVLTPPPHPPYGSEMHVFLADLNQDGRPDIVGQSGWSIGNLGQGRFSESQRLTLNEGERVMGLSDLDGDGRVDLIVREPFNSDVLHIRSGSLQGGFASDPSPWATRCTFTRVVPIKLGGQQGIILHDAPWSGNPGPLQVFQRQGTSWTALPDRLVLPTPSQRPADFQVGDLDQDGYEDVVVAVQSDIIMEPGERDALKVYLGSADGSFRLTQSLPLGVNPKGLTLADIDGDGVLDACLVHTGWTSGNTEPTKLGIFRGLGNGSFENPVLVVVPNMPGFAPAVLDLNGDGRMDIAAPMNLGIQFVLQTSPFAFSPSIRMAPDATELHAIDFNGDGRKDLLGLPYGDMRPSLHLTVVGPTVRGVVESVGTRVKVEGSGLSGEVVSTEDGSYGFTVPLNWSGLVMPTTGTFDPLQRSYSQLVGELGGQDFLQADITKLVRTVPAINVTETGAFLKGIVMPAGFAGMARFEFGPTTDLGTLVGAEPSAVTGHQDVPVQLAISSLQPGTTYHYRVALTLPTRTVHGAIATFTTQPFELNAFSPTSGQPGTVVEITGQGLLGATSVTFNGQQAAFEVLSRDRIRATAPANLSSGPIAVTTPLGTLVTSTAFKLSDIQAPVVGMPTAPGRTGISTLRVQATDDVGVTEVTFLVDDRPVGLGSVGSPGQYSLSLDTKTLVNGTHTLKVQAKDAAGNVGTSAAVPFFLNHNFEPIVSSPTLTTLPSGEPVRFTLAPKALKAGLTFTSKWTFSDGQSLTAADGWRSFLPGTITATWVITDSTGLSDTGTLVLQVASKPTFVEKESNNTRATANLVSRAFGTLQGSRANTGEYDYYAYDVASGETLALDMTGPTGVNWNLYLYSSTGSLRAWSTGATSTERLSWKNTGANQRVYILASHYSGTASGTYAIRIHVTR